MVNISLSIKTDRDFFSNGKIKTNKKSFFLFPPHYYIKKNANHCITQG